MGVFGDAIFPPPVHVVPAAASQLGLRPVSHPHAEILLQDQAHLVLRLATTQPARLRVQTHEIDNPEDDTCADPEEAGGAAEGAPPWEAPRVYAAHDAAGREHTVHVHWDHPDAAGSSGRMLRIYAAGLDVARGDQEAGWPLALEYEVRVSMAEKEKSAGKVRHNTWFRLVEQQRVS